MPKLDDLAHAEIDSPFGRLALVAGSDLTGRAGTSTRDMRSMPSRRRRSVDPLALRPGDYVVHLEHGQHHTLALEPAQYSQPVSPRQAERRDTVSTITTPAGNLRLEF